MSGPRELATPWLPPGAGVSLHWWSEQHLAAVAACLQGGIDSWRAAWGFRGSAPAVECRPLTKGTAALAGWLPLGTPGGACAWVWQPAGWDDDVGLALFGASARTGLTDEVLASLSADAMTRLASALGWEVLQGASHEHSGPGAAHRWSGSVEATLPLLGWRIVLAASGVRQKLQPVSPPKRALEPASPLCSTVEAIRHQEVCLQVVLDGCELELRTLQSLAVGDVVPLRHPLADPAHLMDSTGRQLFSGHLGRQGRSRAVELAGVPSGSERDATHNESQP